MGTGEIVGIRLQGVAKGRGISSVNDVADSMGLDPKPIKMRDKTVDIWGFILKSELAQTSQGTYLKQSTVGRSAGGTLAN